MAIRVAPKSYTCFAFSFFLSSFDLDLDIDWMHHQSSLRAELNFCYVKASLVCVCVSQRRCELHTHACSLIILASLLGHFRVCHPCSLPGVSKEVSQERYDTHIHTKVKIGGDKVTPHLSDTQLLSELGDNSSPLTRHTHTHRNMYIFICKFPQMSVHNHAGLTHYLRIKT